MRRERRTDCSCDVPWPGPRGAVAAAISRCCRLSWGTPAVWWLVAAPRWHAAHRSRRRVLLQLRLRLCLLSSIAAGGRHGVAARLDARY